MVVYGSRFGVGISCSACAVTFPAERLSAREWCECLRRAAPSVALGRACSGSAADRARAVSWGERLAGAQAQRNEAPRRARARDLSSSTIRTLPRSVLFALVLLRLRLARHHPLSPPGFVCCCTCSASHVRRMCDPRSLVAPRTCVASACVAPSCPPVTVASVGHRGIVFGCVR